MSKLRKGGISGFNQRLSKPHQCCASCNLNACTFLLIVTTFILVVPSIESQHNADTSSQCLSRCELARQKGSRGAFQFDCNKYYQLPDEQEYCRGDCRKCSRSICNPSQPNIFNCPPEVSIDVSIDELCESRCDSGRQQGRMEKYTLKCEDNYKTKYEIAECKHDCKNCPNWVCDSSIDKNQFTCPVRNFDGPCKNDYCDPQRKKAGKENSTEVFNFKCADLPDEQEKEACRRSCSTCPKNVCNADVDPNAFYCPSVEPLPVSDELPQAVEESGGGKCTERCNNFRLGGGNSYDMDCVKLFSDHTAQEQCRSDCKTCKPDVCGSEGNGAFIFHCPAAANGISVDPWTIIAIILLLLLIILCCILLYNHCKEKRKNNAVTPSSAEQGESAPKEKGESFFAKWKRDSTSHPNDQSNNAKPNNNATSAGTSSSSPPPQKPADNTQKPAETSNAPQPPPEPSPWEKGYPTSPTKFQQK